ncbi:MAG: VWA domain-containing protein, partial [Clostridiales bacterium]|nr:VWA domain-containing protein [Clostridiales bacterium]
MRCIFKRYVSILICAGMLATSLSSLANAGESTAEPPPTASIEENSASGNEITDVDLSDAEPETNNETGNDNAALSGDSGAIEENAGSEAEAEEASQTQDEAEEQGPTGITDSDDNAEQPDVINTDAEAAVDQEIVNNNETLINADPPIPEIDDEMVLVGVNSFPERSGDELTRVCEDAEVIITATYSAAAGIPDDAEFVVKKITGNASDEILNALETTSGQALAPEIVINDIIFYDISFVLDDVEIEPYEPVKMRFEYKQTPFADLDVNETANVTILHLTDSSETTSAAPGENEQFLVEDVLTVDETLPSEVTHSGRLFDHVEVIHPVVENFEKGRTNIEFDASKFSIYAVALVSIETSEVLYKRVDSIDDVNANYLIVAVDRSYALKAAVNSTIFSAPVALVQVKAHPDYYSVPDLNKTPVTPDMLFTFSATGSEINFSTIKSLTGLYLNIPNTQTYIDEPISFSATDAREHQLAFNSGNASDYATRQLNTWVISNADNDLVSYGGNFLTDNLRVYEKNLVYDTYLSQRAMLIYKQVSDTLTVPGDYTGDGETDVEPDDPVDKPAYPAYIEPSAGKSGSFISSGMRINYDSDASTSQIESDAIFSDEFADDGKVWTDKSVIYGADDYQAFAAYDDGAFSVALSALTQKRIDESKSYDFPLDFVFIVDASGSMNDVVGGKTRAELLNNALNLAIHSIMKSHPQNRVGIVDFATTAKYDLPLGRYYVGGADDTPNYNGAAYDYFYTTFNSPGDAVMKPDAELRDSETKSLAEVPDITFYDATFTQLGIQQGAKMLLENTDTTYSP